MINFQTLELENYQSIEKVKVDLNTNKVYCIIGRNGSGKSSLFEGLIWILYGKARTNKFIRYNSKYTYGKVQLNLNEKNISIIRTKNHPDLGSGCFNSL